MVVAARADGRHDPMAVRMARRIVTRISDELLAEVDELVDAGVVGSRSEAVRLGLRRHRRRASPSPDRRHDRRRLPGAAAGRPRGRMG